LLVERAGQTVTREEIQAILWPENTYVDFDKSLRVAVNKVREALRDSADRPNFVETVPRRGYRFIAPVSIEYVKRSAGDPAPGGVQTPGADLPVVSVQGSAAASGPSQQNSRRVSWWALIALPLVLALAVTLTLVIRRSHQPQSAHEVSAHPVLRRSVAVVGLQNLNPDSRDRWLSTALEEMLSAELSASENLRVIPGEEVARAGLADAPASTPSHETLARYAHQLGADMIVYGSFAVTRQPSQSEAGDMLRLDLRLENFSSDAPSLVLIKTGKSSDLFDLVTASGSDLRQRMGLEALTTEASSAVRKSLPADTTAAQFYAEGVNRLRLFDALGARDLLEKAAKIEPGHAGTHLALSNAWNSLGYDTQARAEAERAVQLSGGLSRKQSLEMQGNRALLWSDGAHATEIFRTLFTFYPDNVDYGLSLANAQVLAGHGNDALATIDTLHWNGISEVDQARIEILRTRLASELGDFPGVIVAADRADSLGRDLNLNLIRAQALWRKAQALENIGKPEDSLAASAEAQRYFRDGGDRRGEAVALLMSGDVQYDRGHLAEAQSIFATALSVFQSIGHRRNTGVTLQRLGNVCFKQGEFEESRKYQAKALAIFQDLHLDSLVASSLAAIGEDQFQQGDLAGAGKSSHDALALFERTGQQSLAAGALNDLGDLELERGALDVAMQDFVREGEIHHKTGFKIGLALSLDGQGDVLVARNELTGSIRIYQEALKLIGAADEPEVWINLQASLGLAELFEGRPQDAIGNLQSAVDLAVRRGDHGDSSLALSWLARAQLANGRIPDATATANRALAESKLQFNPRFSLIALMALARVDLAKGQDANARQELQASLTGAQRFGYLPLALEARILLARTSGSASDQRKQLNVLAQEAMAHGWKRLAAEARMQ